MDQNEAAAADPELHSATWPERESATRLTVVGIGASAGGVRALQDFFENAHTDSGAAFVVVVHLSPEHESYLAEVLSRVTVMPVQQVTESVNLEPNHVYVIPPSKQLVMEDNSLRLAEPEDRWGRRVVIDHFFRTLAAAHGPQATAVVLSGTGADGMLGLKQIKEMGGLTVAQEPSEAEHEGMPRNAIATGMVDYVLPAREISAQIVAYWDTSRSMRLPAEAAPSPEQREEGPLQEESLRDILAHVRAKTGHDFGNYKRATVLRRIGRRLQVNGQRTLPDYLGFLRRHPAEVPELVGDLLISVTQFFRDPEAWLVLEFEILPLLIEALGPDDIFRAWVCGCATGEEAYSLAIIASEIAQRLDRPLKIQLFATDMDTIAIGRARAGLYPDTIAGDVSPERLRRWFHRQNSQYQVKKEIRESILFASHDVLRDTPFSRLDLVTCRNLMIYLNREAQERIYTTFHFALRPDGRLLLGQSESVDSFSRLFAATDKQHRIYTRRLLPRPPPLFTQPIVRAVPIHRPVPITGVDTEGVVSPPPALPSPRAASADELHRTVLELYASPSVLVNAEQEILHLSDNAGQYLRLSGGTPTASLLRLVHPDLRIELRTALYAAASEEADQVRVARMTFNEGSPSRLVRLRVRQVQGSDALKGYLLVLFEELPEEALAEEPVPVSALAGEAALPTSSLLAQQLEDEIARLQLQLRSTVEQYEASVEELKASNEELQAMNEELRSAAEELETSKEELQSVNEELTTVNHELKSRMEELSQANGDLQNLLASTDIGILFLDRALRVQRYTPAIATLFNIIASDAGRPFAHLTHRLDTDELPKVAETVLERLAFYEREVNSTDGEHYLARLRPYRTLDDKIDGVVVVFIDITERKRAETALKESKEQFRLLVEGAVDYAMFLMDQERRIVFWSRGAERVFGWTEAEAVGRSGDIIFTPDDVAAGAPNEEVEVARSAGRAPDQRWHLRKDGTRFWADGLLTLLDDATSDRAFVKITRDATEQRRAEEELLQAHNELETRVTERTQALEILNNKQVELSQRLMTAQEEERRRISRELHDETGQDLTALLLGLGSLPMLSHDPAAFRESVARLQSLGDDLAKKMHQIAVRMRPTALDDLGLEAALRTFVEEWSSQNGITAELETIGSGVGRLPTEIETVIYRVVQESLQNVLKHAAEAKEVSIILRHDPKEVLAIIEDNGAGFDLDEISILPLSGQTPRRSLGVLGMRERAALVGGALAIESAPGKGTTVFLRIPFTPEGT